MCFLPTVTVSPMATAIDIDHDSNSFYKQLSTRYTVLGWLIAWDVNARDLDLRKFKSLLAPTDEVRRCDGILSQRSNGQLLVHLITSGRSGKTR